MTSWRATTSAAAQDDLEGLLDAALELAVEELTTTASLVPFALTLDVDGATALAATPGRVASRTTTNEVLDDLVTGVRATAATLRAAAFVAPVVVDQADAVRVELEHREGVGLVVRASYTRRRFPRSVTVGDLAAAVGNLRVWAPAP